jgi:hypothetical protein
MVDPDLLRRKVAQVLHHVARLRRHVAISAQDLRGNEDLYNGVLMDLQQAIRTAKSDRSSVC